jgi:transposase
MVRWEKLRWPWNAWEPIPRIGEKNGRKRSLLVDARGTPLSVVVSGANVHDSQLLDPTLAQIQATKPDHDDPHLCADAGYRGQPAMQCAKTHGYQPHIKQRREEAADKKAGRHPPRRWVVERTHSWFNRFRKLLVSFEKTEQAYLGLLLLAAACITWRQVIFIYG